MASARKRLEEGVESIVAGRREGLEPRQPAAPCAPTASLAPPAEAAVSAYLPRRASPLVVARPGPLYPNAGPRALRGGVVCVGRAAESPRVEPSSELSRRGRPNSACPAPLGGALLPPRLLPCATPDVGVPFTLPLVLLPLVGRAVGPRLGDPCCELRGSRPVSAADRLVPPPLGRFCDKRRPFDDGGRSPVGPSLAAAGVSVCSVLELPNPDRMRANGTLYARVGCLRGREAA